MSNNEEWNVNILLENLKCEIESREMCNHMTINKNKESELSTESEDYFTGSTLYSGRGNVTITCTYCRRDHPSAKCNAITDVKARKAILRNKAKCFVCLKSGHLAKNCHSRIKCYKCNNRHHISICDVDV